MTDLMRYASMLENAGAMGAPPVETWDPPYCGEIDIVIRRDGTWFHEGTPIGRAPLVRLFSSIIRKDDDEYFLVTPVEKLKIRVEDAPFVAVLMRAEAAGTPDQRLIFRTQVGDEITAGPGHAIEMRPVRAARENDPVAGEEAPYIHVRRGLGALIARAVFYDLAALGETRDVEGVAQFGVVSDGVFFPLRPAADMEG